MHLDFGQCWNSDSGNDEMDVFYENSTWTLFWRARPVKFIFRHLLFWGGKKKTEVNSSTSEYVLLLGIILQGFALL